MRLSIYMQLKPTIRKVPADSVRYGTDVSAGKLWVWAVYSAKDELLGIAATKKEARVLELKALGVYGRPLPLWSTEHSLTKEARTLAHKLKPGEQP